MLGVQAHFHLFADQAARHRVAIPVDVNQTAGIDAHVEPLARLQAPRRQRP
jgi:hypothetical protein